MAYFPLFVDLTEKECLVVGGGKVALRKVKILLDFEARVTVLANKICDEIKNLSEANLNLSIRQDMFSDEAIDGYYIVIAATNYNALNSHIAALCKRKNIQVNVVDKIEECSFILPAIIKKQDIVAAFSSGGKSPVLTQYLKARNEGIVTNEIGKLNAFMGEVRETVKEEIPTEEFRKETFKAIIDFAFGENMIPSEEQTKKIIAEVKKNHEL